MRFQNPDPISTYLLTIVAAELDTVRDTYRSVKGPIPLAIYTGKGRGGEVAYVMSVIKRAMAMYEAYFGRPYPWSRYGKAPAAPYVGSLAVALIGSDYLEAKALAITRTSQTFAVTVPAEPVAISINRDNQFLGQFVIEQQDTAAWAVAVARESSGYGRFAAVDQLLRTLEGNVPPPHPAIRRDFPLPQGERENMEGALFQAIRRGLTDPLPAVRWGVGGLLTSADRDPVATKRLARAVVPTLLGRLDGSAADPIVAAEQQQALILLGVADDADTYPTLRSHTRHPVADLRLGAIEGLLKSSVPDRFTAFEAALHAARTQPAQRLELLRTLARTPDPAAITKLAAYLSDRTLIPADDSSTPIRAWGTLRNFNRRIVTQPEVIAVIGTFVRANLDRPLVAAAALRALEGTKDAPPAARTEVRAVLDGILAANPPELVKSIAGKIVAAVR